AQKKLQTAIAQGLNEGGDLTRTRTFLAMRQQTGLKQLKSVTSRSSTQRAYAPGSLRYTLNFRGKPPTKPNEFATNVRTGPGGGVTVWFWGKAHTFPRSFQQKIRGG